VTDEPAVLTDLDITRPGFFLRPDYYEVLAWLRANQPAFPLPDGSWLISRHDDIRMISSQPDRFRSRSGVLVNDPMRAVDAGQDHGSLIHLDPPKHAAYRKLLNRRFTPRASAGLEPVIRRKTDEAFAGLAAGDEVDFVETIAAPVPVEVIAELLGIADGDRADFRRWSDAMIVISDNPGDETLAAAGAELFAFLDDHIRERAREPRDDLISTLLASSVEGAQLTRAEVLMFCMTLLVAGNETTRTLLAGAAEVLAQHPDQRARLADTPDAIPNAVEELLRWVTPIQAFCRTATTASELGGTAVPEGGYVVLLYASGNRDEAAYGPTAGQFDAFRPAHPAHVAFGFGEHLCLGAALARLEARVVLEQLLARFPDYELLGEPELLPSTLTRGIQREVVRLA